MTRAHILVQALSGRGKTFWASMGGKPYIIAPERKCQSLIPLINPNAKVFPLDTREDYDKAIIAVQSEKLVENGYTRIVLDSFSELTEFIPGWFGMGYPLQIQDYGTIGNKAMTLVLAMLKSPIPGIVICRSEAKEQGKVSRVVPGSLGKSAANLPAKLILTAETRHDDQAGWIVDTTPDDYTQRAGLPWVPTIFQGSADEFLARIEAGPAGVSVFTVPQPSSASATATNATASPVVTEGKQATQPGAQSAAQPVAQAIEPDQAFIGLMAELAAVTLAVQMPLQSRMALIDLWEKDGPADLDALRAEIATLKSTIPQETPGESIQAQQQDALSRKDPVSAAAAAFVDTISPAILSDMQWLRVQELCLDASIILDELERYCEDKGKIAPVLPNAKSLPRPLRGLTQDAWAHLEPILSDTNRRRSFVAAVKHHCSSPRTQAA